MSKYRQIRASYDQKRIVVYQAYKKEIAIPAINSGKFVPPFSWGRMTWIKPSYLWMMARSNWGQKTGQEYILALHLSRTGWEQALGLAEYTCFDQAVHPNMEDWRTRFESAQVHVQWDPERSIQGKKLDHRSIQIGISRNVIKQFTDEWILELEDLTPLTKKIRALCLSGNYSKAKQFLPKEREYPVNKELAKRLGISN